MVQIGLKGYFWGVFAFSFWGVVPLYWMFINSIGAIELTIHRVFWGSLTLTLFSIFSNAFRDGLLRIFKSKKSFQTLTISTLLIGFNWGVFIYSVQSKQLLAASLGYFINPLFNIFIGRIIFKEDLSRFKVLAIVLAGIGIGLYSYQGIDNIFITAGLFVSFGLYGAIRKSSPIDPLPGLYLEMSSLVIPGLLYVFLKQGGSQWPLQTQTLETFLIPFSGLITLLPLFAFNVAVKELPYSTVGILQYLAPTFQFILGFFVFNEAMTSEKIFAFGFVWLALIFYTYELLQDFSKRRNLNKKSP